MIPSDTNPNQAEEGPQEKKEEEGLNGCVRLEKLENMVTYLEISQKKNQGMIRSSIMNLIEIDPTPSKRLVPSYHHNTNYKEIVKEQLELFRVLQVIYSQSREEVEEINKKCSKKEASNYELELKVNPKWKRRRKKYQLEFNYKVIKFFLFFLVIFSKNCPKIEDEDHFLNFLCFG